MLTELPEWQALQAHYQEIKEQKMRDWFAANPERFSQFSIRLGDLLFDYSKNRMTLETIKLFTRLAKACDLPTKIQNLFSVAPINSTESRPALHTALRHQAETPIIVQGEDVMPMIRESLAKMGHFAKAIHEGRLCGATGKPFHEVVNIGIGGSHLGPRMVTHAFSQQAKKPLRFHFISDIDGFALQEVLGHLDPERTLFIVSSKSFSTMETLANAKACQAWLKAKLPLVMSDNQWRAHFVAVTARQDKAREFGIIDDRIFPLWDWVGGRYSVWSSIGLPVVLQIGVSGFQDFLKGANAADQHFLTAPLAQNIPVLMGMLGIWYHNFFEADTHAIISYDHRLKYLRAYLQQLDMESNGKRTTHPGKSVNYSTGPIIWGESGIHGQHAFHQLLHQGTHLVPVDFLLIAQKDLFEEQEMFASHQDLLIANALCQAGALMNGRDFIVDEATATDCLAKHKSIPGNRPSNIFFLDKLTPYSLGTLIAFYEHKIFVQSVIWDINPFDQWGVELGKTMLSLVLKDFHEDSMNLSHDSSTANLISHYKKLKKTSDRVSEK